MSNLRTELECRICMEIFVSPTLLGCGHLFCRACIDKWKRKKKQCPLCREKIKSCVSINNGNAIISEVVALMLLHSQEQCLDIIRASEPEPGQKIGKKRKRCGSSNRSHPINSQDQTQMELMPRRLYTNSQGHCYRYRLPLQNLPPLQVLLPYPMRQPNNTQDQTQIQPLPTFPMMPTLIPLDELPSRARNPLVSDGTSTLVRANSRSSQTIDLIES